MFFKNVEEVNYLKFLSEAIAEYISGGSLLEIQVTGFRLYRTRCFYVYKQ